MYEIEYYTEKDKFPVFEFIREQSPKAQAKMLREIDLLPGFPPTHNEVGGVTPKHL